MERGLSGTANTIAKMHKLIALGKLDPTIQKIATWLRIQVPSDYRGSGKRLADHVFRFVRRHQVFQRDPFQVEKIEHPIESMRPIIEARRSGAYKGRALVVGDCDTLSAVWLGSLLGAMGYQYALETFKVDKGRPEEFSHVLLSVKVGNEWYPLDPSTPGVSPGWRPPVPPDAMKRWHEKKIEETVGMSGLNGSGLGADEKQRLGQDDWPDAPLRSEWVQHSEYGYGIPKNLGNPRARKRVPLTTAGRVEQIVPDQPALARSDMERPLSDYTKRLKPWEMNPAGRISARDYQRPAYTGKRPYITTQKPYPPGSIWNGPIAYEVYPGRRPYVHTQRPKVPTERRVDVVLQEPVPFRRGKVRSWPGHKSKLVFMRPNIPSASLEGYGMGQYLPPAGSEAYLTSREVLAAESGMGASVSVDSRAFELITQGMDATKAWAQAESEAGESGTQKTEDAAKASTSIWDSVTKTLTDLVPKVGSALIKRQEAKYAEKIADATQRVTGESVPANVIQGSHAVNYRPPTPIWQSPFVWVGGALILGGVAYIALRRRPATTRRRGTRRRYRTNVSGMRYRRRAA